MRPTTQRLFLVAVLLFIASVVGGVLALIFQWPAQLTRTLEGGLGSPNVTVGDLITEGTVTSLPLFPRIAFTVFALLARSRRWWGTLAVVGLCLLALVFFAASVAEVEAPFVPSYPRAVLLISVAVYILLALMLLVTGVLELVDRARTRRSASARLEG